MQHLNGFATMSVDGRVGTSDYASAWLYGGR
jgi:hypothetical protein